MGQSFSLTALTTSTARLQRELAAAKGKCAKIDKIVVGLERDLKRVTEERDALTQFETDATALEEENARLERRVAALSDAEKTPSTKRECDDCEKRIAKLKEDNATIRRKLIAPTTRPISVPEGTSRAVVSMKTRIKSLESEVKRSQEKLRREMAYALQDFSLTTYTKSWSLRAIVTSRSGDIVRAFLVIEQFEYTALIRYKGSVLTIHVGGRTRTVPNGKTLWNAILKDAGKEVQPVVADRFRKNNTPTGVPAIADRFRRNNTMGRKT